MNINLNNFNIFISTFREKLAALLTPQQKKIAMVVSVALACITTIHFLSRYCFFQGRKVSNLKLRLTGSGQGKITLIDGDIQEGRFQNHKLHGQGKSIDGFYLGGTYFPRSIREGNFQNGVLQGKGKSISWELANLKNVQKIVSVGEFQNDKLHGQGKVTYEDGKLTKGEFQEGVFKKGILIEPNGTILEGEFDGDLIKGKIIFPDERIEVGEFDDNDLIKGKIIHPDGRIELK